MSRERRGDNGGEGAEIKYLTPEAKFIADYRNHPEVGDIFQDASTVDEIAERLLQAAIRLDRNELEEKEAEAVDSLVEKFVRVYPQHAARGRITDLLVFEKYRDEGREQELMTIVRRCNVDPKIFKKIAPERWNELYPSLNDPEVSEERENEVVIGVLADELFARWTLDALIDSHGKDLPVTAPECQNYIKEYVERVQILKRVPVNESGKLYLSAQITGRKARQFRAEIKKWLAGKQFSPITIIR